MCSNTKFDYNSLYMGQAYLAIKHNVTSLGKFSVAWTNVVTRFAGHWTLGQPMESIIQLLQIMVPLQSSPSLDCVPGNILQVAHGFPG